MGSIRFEDNKILFDGNAVAMHEDCCCDTVSGTCCGDDCSSEPRYLRATFSGVTRCGVVDCSYPYNYDCDDLNTSWILEREECSVPPYGLDCAWFYENTAGGYPIDAWITADDKWRVDGSPYLDTTSQPQCYSYSARSHCFWGRSAAQTATNCGICDALPLTINQERPSCGANTQKCKGSGGSVYLEVP